MGKDKPCVIEGLRYLVEKKIEVVAVVGPQKQKPSLGPKKLIDVANDLNLPIVSDEDLYQEISNPGSNRELFSLDNIDLIISFLFWKKIKKPLIDLPKIGCINFHPSPLPDVRGVSGYTFGIYENFPFWGVSAHFVDEDFDAGDLVKVIKFDIDPMKENSYSLAQKSLPVLLELFKEVIDIASKTGSLPRVPQDRNQGRYFSQRDFDELRKIKPTDSLDEIERKVRAFWHPPFAGASIEIKGKEFTVLNDEVIKEIAKHFP